MSNSNSKIAVLLGTAFALAAVAGTARIVTVRAQDATPAPAPAAGRLPPPPPPVAPNPHYKRDDNWAQIPGGEKWGVMSAVDIDAKGEIYVLQRTPSKIMVFDPNGKFLRSWADGQFEFAHGLRITPDQKIWVTDRKGEMAYKYDLEGKLLMTLGKKDVAGDNDSQDTFNGIADVVVGKDGNLFVADGEDGNTRVVKLTKDGKFIKEWGTKGSDPGQFRMPHNVAIDSRGRLWVCDRTNKRIQIFDQDGNFLQEMPQFGAASGLFITKDDMVYVADTPPQSSVIIGTLDGKILDTIPGLYLGHGIVIDSKGAIYVADGGASTVAKFTKQ